MIFSENSNLSLPERIVSEFKIFLNKSEIIQFTDHEWRVPLEEEKENVVVTGGIFKNGAYLLKQKSAKRAIAMVTHADF